MIFPATVSKVQTMADRSLQVRLDTQELPPKAMAGLFDFYGNYCHVQLVSSVEEATEIAPPSAPKASGKTPAQRLRAVLYRLWEQDKKGHKDSNTYYDMMMEQIIEFYKSKLED